MQPEHPVKSLPLRQRGNYSKNFKDIPITSNHFKAELDGINKIVVYDFKITPRVQGKNDQLLKKIWEGVRKKVEAKIKRPVWKKFCLFASEESPEKFEAEAEGFKVEISQRKVHDFTKLPVFLMFLNVSLRGIMSRLGYSEIGRSGKYFTSASTEDIDCLKMYKGYSSAFQECENGIYLRVDTARKIVRKDTVLQNINSIMERYKAYDKQERRNQIKKALVDSIVMTTYGKTTFYRVLDVEFVNMMDVPISEEIPNLWEYYSKKYNIQVKNTKQPLLRVENKIKKKEKAGSSQGPTYILPELCSLTGIPENFDEMRRKKVSEKTILPPQTKAVEINKFMSVLNDKKEIQNLDRMGIKISKKMNKFNAKRIENPILELGSKQIVDKAKVANFSLFGQPIFAAKHNIDLTIIHSKNTDVKDLIGTFEQTSKKLKVDISIKKFQHPMFKEPDVINALSTVQKYNQKTNILLVVIPASLKTSYPKFKQHLLAEKKGQHMLSQFVVETTLRKKGVQSIHTKLLLQIIAKRGNILWAPQLSAKLSDRLAGTCLIAIDSASKGSTNVISSCGTTNSTFTLHSSSRVVVDKSENKYQYMLKVAADCVAAYNTRNKGAPNEVIIFMNAVPGDQVNLIQENVAQKLKALVSETYKIQLNLTIIMVNLRNSERFFTDSGPEVRNVFPGTLVSNTIVSPHYDFFIVSQQSFKGSIVPNHYRVIYSTSKLEEGHLQELIFSQCFSYANWTGSIKVPSILQYAKKCAKFHAEVLLGEAVSAGLEVRLFFI